MAIASINPATGEKVKEFAPFDDAEIEKRLKSAENAFRKYRRTAFSQRSELLEATAELLLQEKERLAEIITLEMGKLFPASVEEILKCARACRFYAENAERFLEDEPAQTDAARSYVRYEPLGPVLAIMPWNFPFWQVFRFATPALMAGNVGLLKHASNVPQCALAIEDILQRAGFPPGVFQTLLIESRQVGPVVADPRVAAVTLTGSQGAGSQVASLAGKHSKESAPETSPAYRDELFGPVAAIFRVPDAAAAIGLANDSVFGLAASVWTNDDRERAQFIDQLQTGQVFVNSMVASDPRLPFGGVKRSGYGRELSLFGIREFVNIK